MNTTAREASMDEVITVGLDLAKSVFQAHGADASGEVVFRKKLRRDQVAPFFSKQQRCLVAMEACGSAHRWSRRPLEAARAIPGWRGCWPGSLASWSRSRWPTRQPGSSGR